MTAAPVVLTAQDAKSAILPLQECACPHCLATIPKLEAIASGSVVCRVADGWRPIESAPPMTYVLVGRYMGDPWGFVRGTGYFKEGSISGWVCRGICDPPGELGLGNPTHWQPFPAPPKEQSDVRQ